MYQGGEKLLQSFCDQFDSDRVHYIMPFNPNLVIGPGRSPEQLSPILRDGTKTVELTT